MSRGGDRDLGGRLCRPQSVWKGQMTGVPRDDGGAFPEEGRKLG